MPFGALEHQAIGISLLKARLAEANIACDIRYLTFAFAEFIGYEEYQWVSFELPYTSFAGDWAFTRGLYSERPDIDGRYIQEVLRDTWQLDEPAIRRIMRIRSFVPHYLDYCMAAVPWQEYAIVGFTSTFAQNLASLALASRIKAAHPAITIVFGGANWEAEMGQELHRQFQYVDYVCSGEADESFPALVRHLLADAPIDSGMPIPGIVYRAGGESIASGPARLISALDDLPIPDFSDYFADLGQSTIAAHVLPCILFETSRGCWWGAKSHCTFCGLNGGTMAFRSKSARRALDELEYLVDRWQVDLVVTVDNILDMRYFNDLLPTLAEARRPMRIFYEVKANLSRKQIAMLAAAGVYRIQPGLESLSDHVLQLMHKGTTALRNIQLLKWCKEYGIDVMWSILYGFPGETREDYLGILDLLPAIRFLTPPTVYTRIRLDRFSPYYDAAEAHGFRNVRPIAPYRYLYPFDDASLSRIAYCFDYDYAPDADPTGYAEEIFAYLRAWQRAPEPGLPLASIQPDGTLALVDTRSDALCPEIILSGSEQAAYLYCDELRSAAAVTRYLRAHYPELQFTEPQVIAFLDTLVANRLMVTDRVHYLSLAIMTQQLQQGEAWKGGPLQTTPQKVSGDAILLYTVGGGD
jgi:ribosomal peptide maturation radical SAM protein 1